MEFYTLENFECMVIEQTKTREEANIREMFWIKFYDSISPNGYNLTSGGVWCFEHSEESKKKNSIAHLGEKNWNFGKPKSPEWKQFMSKRMTGNSHCKNLGLSRVGEQNPNFDNHWKDSPETITRKVVARRKRLRIEYELKGFCSFWI